MMPKHNWIILLLSLISIDVFAQIEITFPVSRIVFQRNNQNQANVNIAGSYFQQLDRIDARAVPVFGGQGAETEWITIQNNLSTGIFNGSLLLNGGWYNIELRGILNDNLVTTTVLERVGVGEVFIVSGQSNAQGDAIYSGGSTGSSDDRVSTINYYDAALDENRLPFQFSHMGNFTKMAPYNYIPWFWSRLGDKLAQKLNVPILFYGAALGGIGSDIWRRSVEGEDMRNELQTFIKVAGMPYRGMKAALQQYVTRTGVRAILWQQGESDENTLAEAYYHNLKTVIEKSRNDSKKVDLAWVIARSSRNPNTHQNVINGQNFVIRRIPNVFNGPETDEIVGGNLRADGIHFHKEGLNRAAEYWSSTLNDSFFSSSQPLLSRELPKVYLSCDANNINNKYTISSEGGFERYNWNNGNTSNSLNVDSGTYSLKTQDDVGNTFFSQPIYISPNNSVVPPVINIGGAATFCQGGYVSLTSNISEGNIWSNGEQSQTIFVTNTNTFTVTNTTLYGCRTTSSPVSINVLPLPNNKILTNKSLPICPDDNITLVANNFENVTYLWNTNATSPEITVKDAGSYSLNIRGENGCESQSFFDVTVRQRPVTNIVADGTLTFCSGKSVNLASKNDFSAYFWSNGASTKTTNINNSGNYSLKVQDNFGCMSESVNTSIVVNPLPTFQIIAEGVEKFCEGNIVNLQPSSNEELSYRWNTGETKRNIQVAKPGIYILTVKDKNSCESKPDSIALKYIPPPSVSITTADNLNTICQGSNIKLNGSNAVSYSWNNGSTANNILVDKAGIYTLKIRDDKNCESNPVSFEVFMKNTPTKPSIFVEGAYQLEVIPTSFINGQFFEWKVDNTNLPTTTTIIKSNLSGNYSVRTVVKYALPNNVSLVCYSPFSDNLNFSIPVNDKGMRVYPNPNPTGMFYLETINENANSYIHIYSLSGQEVLTLNISDLKEKRLLNLSTLERGTYIMRLVSGEFTATTTLIIKY